MVNTTTTVHTLQVKSEYVHHKAISGAIGVKICATGIEKAVAGTPIMVVGPDDDEEDIKEEVSHAYVPKLSVFLFSCPRRRYHSPKCIRVFVIFFLFSFP